MVKTKTDLNYFLECDRLALGKKGKKPGVFGDEIWKFQICMRKLNYYKNNRGVLKWYYRFKYHKLSLKLGFSIPCDVIGPGVKIVGNVCIGDGVVVGANAVVNKDIPSGVTVGGVPAKIISNNNSDKHLVKATNLVGCGGNENE